MAYVIDPTNPASPADTDPAASGAGEFRALKGYIQGLISGGSSFKSYAWQGFRNQIINGDFRFLLRPELAAGAAGIAQECWGLELGTGTAVTSSRQNFALGQTEVPGNPKYFRRHVVTAAGDAANGISFFRQRIQNVETMAGTTGYLTFYAKADAARPIAFNASQVFGTGGSPSAITVNGVQKVTLSTVWQAFTFPITLPSVFGKTKGTTPGTDYIQIGFYFSAGSSFNANTNTLGNQTGTFDIANVQFEPITNTPFENRPDSVELQLAQQFAVVYGPAIYAGTGVAGANNVAYIQFHGTQFLRNAATNFVLLGSGTISYVTDGGSNLGYNSVGTQYRSQGGPLTGNINVSGSSFVLGRAALFYTEGRTLVISADL